MSKAKLQTSWETELYIVPGIVQVIAPVGIKRKSFTEEVAQ